MNEDNFKVLLVQKKFLRILAEGCKKHPAYRGKRKPQSQCVECKRIHDSRLALKSIGEL